MKVTNETRRRVMNVAWSFRREEPTRSFADCLRGAWKWIKGMAKTAAHFMARVKRSRGGWGATVRSAAWDSTSGNPYRGVALGRSSAGDSWAGR
jgi:hypothetical protein